MANNVVTILLIAPSLEAHRNVLEKALKMNNVYIPNDMDMAYVNSSRENLLRIVNSVHTSQIVIDLSLIYQEVERSLIIANIRKLLNQTEFHYIIILPEKINNELVDLMYDTLIQNNEIVVSSPRMIDVIASFLHHPNARLQQERRKAFFNFLHNHDLTEKMVDISNLEKDLDTSLLTTPVDKPILSSAIIADSSAPHEESEANQTKQTTNRQTNQSLSATPNATVASESTPQASEQLNESPTTTKEQLKPTSTPVTPVSSSNQSSEKRSATVPNSENELPHAKAKSTTPQASQSAESIKKQPPQSLASENTKPMSNLFDGAFPDDMTFDDDDTFNTTSPPASSANIEKQKSLSARQTSINNSSQQMVKSDETIQDETKQPITNKKPLSRKQRKQIQNNHDDYSVSSTSAKSNASPSKQKDQDELRNSVSQLDEDETSLFTNIQDHYRQWQFKRQQKKEAKQKLKQIQQASSAQPKPQSVRSQAVSSHPSQTTKTARSSANQFEQSQANHVQSTDTITNNYHTRTMKREDIKRQETKPKQAKTHRSWKPIIIAGLVLILGGGIFSLGIYVLSNDNGITTNTLFKKPLNNYLTNHQFALAIEKYPNDSLQIDNYILNNNSVKNKAKSIQEVYNNAREITPVLQFDNAYFNTNWQTVIDMSKKLGTLSVQRKTMLGLAYLATNQVGKAQKIANEIQIPAFTQRVTTYTEIQSENKQIKDQLKNNHNLSNSDKQKLQQMLQSNNQLLQEDIDE